jgi:hypothetical protein
MKKIFDCVEMKDTIQRRLQTEEAGLTPAEREEHRQRRIEDDPILGPWVARQRQRNVADLITNL